MTCYLLLAPAPFPDFEGLWGHVRLVGDLRAAPAALAAVCLYPTTQAVPIRLAWPRACLSPWACEADRSNMRSDPSDDMSSNTHNSR